MAICEICVICGLALAFAFCALPFDFVFASRVPFDCLLGNPLYKVDYPSGRSLAGTG
jgi:hypothetical protein